ncbi:MAG TPA: alpha/beta hydrolase [Roseiarcus sp.]|nr:alpha/beta hydrolase [Roseiarcus sp.]
MKAFSWAHAPHGAILADGNRLEAAALGPPPDVAPTIVLLHEGLGCVDLWREFPERLADATGFGVLAFSRSGYGRSDPIPLPRPLDYMTREARDALPAVLGAIGFQRGVLVGHSDGASMAAIYAGLFDDERVKGLVLIAPHLFAEAPGLASIAEAKRAYEAGDLKARLAKHHAHVDAAFLGWAGAWLDPGFRTWNIESHVELWRVPALVIQGVDDQYGTLEQVRAIETHAPSSVETLILKQCRHAPQFEQPERTLEAISRFCKNRLRER